MPDRDRPQVIGPYTIVGTLGEGGMGVVYLAEQTEPVRRTVALKVLRADVSSEQMMARFRAERQALAVMDHPSIAKMFAAGQTDDGYTYFAMERVEGLPITEFCDARRMPIRDRLHLFVELCEAVQHAHRKGLIHRDLKPSNVLVSEEGERPIPHVIDFGIAKVMDVEKFDGTKLTRADQLIGTPAYMSPEQIDGAAGVDTRTDIYSLGMLLYELLVGALPHEKEAYQGWAALAASLRRDPPSLSQRLGELSDTQVTVAEARRASVATLRSELRGDLDWIVARAIERDPELRYETVNALAEDIQRFLGHRPVMARGQSAAYVARKFVRRNRVVVAFAATLLVGLVTFAISTAVQVERVARARDVADSRRNQAEALIDFMLGDLREKLQPIGRLEILDDVGTEAMEYFAALPESEFTDDELQRRSQALYQIGEVRAGEGRLSDAREAFEESLRLAQALSDRDPTNPDRLFALGQSRFWVGYMDWRTGDFADALEHFYPYREVSERLVAMDPDNLDWRLELGYAHSNIGSIREAMADFRGAAESFRESLAVDSFLVTAAPDDRDRQLDLARSHNTLGVALAKAGSFAAAEPHHRTELAIKQALVRSDSANAIWLRELTLADRYLAALLDMRGRDTEAMALLREGLAVSRRLTRMDPDNANWQDGLAVSLTQAAATLLRLDSLEAADAALREGRALFDELLEGNPENPRWRRLAAQALYGQARLALATGRTTDVRASVDSALALLEPMVSDRSDAEAVELHAHLRLVAGDALALGGDVDGARLAWTAAAGPTPGAADSAAANETAMTRAARAGALARLGRDAEARLVLDALTDGGLALRDPWIREAGTTTTVDQTPR